MIDKKKRDTLKVLSTATAVAAAPSLLNAKSFAADVDAKSVGLANNLAGDLANIDIKVRVSVTSNDLELLISNTGAQATNITQLTPSHLQTARGYFDMQGILNDGPISLSPGGSVTVPHTRQADNILSSKANTLIKDLQDRVSIITDNDAFAAVNVSRMPYFV